MRTQLTSTEDIKGCKIEGVYECDHSPYFIVLLGNNKFFVVAVEGSSYGDSPFLFLCPKLIVPITDSIRDLIKAGVISQEKADQEVTRRRREWEKDRRTQDLATLKRLKVKYEGD